MTHRHYVNADGDLALEGKGLDKHELKAQPTPPLEGRRKVQISSDAHTSRSLPPGYVLLSDVSSSSAAQTSKSEPTATPFGSFKVFNRYRCTMLLALMSVLPGSMAMMVGRNASVEAAKLATHRCGPAVNEAH